jgi:hypothetical protein
MQTIEHRWIDKQMWPRGLWDNEPDKVQWEDEDTGLACLAVRHERRGHFCGYVGVAPEDRSKLPVDEYGSFSFSVHGGVTFSGLCDGDEQHGICHVPGPGEPDPLLWIGFDCAHHLDLSPVEHERMEWATYRDLTYVQRECRDLARQIKTALQKDPT